MESSENTSRSDGSCLGTHRDTGSNNRYLPNLWSLLEPASQRKHLVDMAKATYYERGLMFELAFIFGIAAGFLVGFIQNNGYRSIRTLLVSKLVAIPAFIAILIFASTPFPPIEDSTTLGGSSSSFVTNNTSGAFLGMYIFVFILLIVIAEIPMIPAGYLLGENGLIQRQAHSIRLTLTRLTHKRSPKRIQS
jgi:hypothetical protein